MQIGNLAFAKGDGVLVSFSIEDYLFVMFNYSACALCIERTRFQYQHGSQTRVQSLNVSLDDRTVVT